MSDLKSSSGKGLALAGYDYVSQDRIWKDHIEHERGSVRGWDSNWKFMKTSYKDLVRDEWPQTTRDPVPVPEHLRINQGPPLEECVTVLPSSKPLPKTTAGEIGWRSGDNQLKLDKYGLYCRPKGGLLKQLKWPDEAVG